MEKIITAAPAKINLWLEVLGRRPDGYHDIKSIMQTVSLYDYITIRKIDEPAIRVSGNSTQIGYGRDNLAYRAAESFLFRNCHINCGVDITIEKNIPIGAGLAGGSTDAAAVISGMNELFSTGLKTDELCDIGKEIGSDIPFCIVKGTAFISGKGDIIKKIGHIKLKNIVITKGNDSVSTAEAYSLLDRYGKEKAGFEIEGYVDGKINSFPLFNSFEKPISALIPDIEVIKNEMNAHGAYSSLMSGSGPSVFGLFSSRDDAVSCRDKLIETGYFAALCDSVE